LCENERNNIQLVTGCHFDSLKYDKNLKYCQWHND